MIQLLWLLLAAFPIELVGEADCPSRDDVARALARLAPAVPTGGDARLSADIQRQAGGLSVTLRDGEGRLLAERVVAGSGACAELAAAAAVVITAWQGELRPDLGPGLPESPAARAAPPGGQVTAVSRAAVPTSEPRPRPMEVGAALLASAAAGDLAPGFQLDAEVGLRASGVAARLAAAFAGPHAIALGPNPGQSRWSRAGLGLGLRHRSWAGAFALDGDLTVQGAAVFVSGTGFDHDYDRVGFDLGLGAGLRLARAAGRFAPFVGVGASVWPNRNTVAITGAPAESALPRFELGAAAGVSFGRFR